MKLKLLLILLLLSTAVSAQIQKEKGKLTLTNGDVLNGAITHYYETPTDIIFYNGQGAKEVFSSDQVNEIRLDNGAKFVAREYKTQEGKNTIILQVLLESPKISLYKREDNTAQYYYVSKENVLYRLENNEVEEYKGAKTYKRKDNKYIGTLSSLMSDNFQLTQKLDRVGLNESDLTRIITEYNQGEVSYYWKSDTKKPAEPNLVVFAQHSQLGSIYGNPTVGSSSGQMVGIQYYFSKHGRHSLKLSWDHSKYALEDENAKLSGLGLRYELAFKRAEYFNVYMMIHVIEMVHLSITDERGAKVEDGWNLMPRVSPGFGFEAKPLPRTAVYVEVNNLMQLDRLPKSFSLGLKYDFGKTSW